MKLMQKYPQGNGNIQFWAQTRGIEAWMTVDKDCQRIDGSFKEGSNPDSRFLKAIKKHLGK
jgi:hypothetical protein